MAGDDRSDLEPTRELDDQTIVDRDDEVRPSGEDQPVRLGRYRLIEELGRGAMGVVWRAQDEELRRPVALKRLAAEAGASRRIVERFTREARAAARLRHPNLVAVHDVGVVDGVPFLTSDLIEGRSLEAVLADGRPPVESFVRLVRALADGLAHAHERGVVHRDVKPANILIDGSGQPHLTDFGLAKGAFAEDEVRLTREGAILGTPRYMSPEQATGRSEEVGPASDQFSLGSVFYEGLTGRAPFAAGDVPTTLVAIARLEPEPPTRLDRRIPRDLETIVLKALEKDPAARYPTMAAFGEDLERHLAGEPILARPVGPAGRLWRRVVRQRKILVPSLVALGLAGVLAAGWIGDRRSDERRRRALLARAADLEEAGDLAGARTAYREAQVVGDDDDGAARAGRSRVEAVLAHRAALVEACRRDLAAVAVLRRAPAVDRAAEARLLDAVAARLPGLPEGPVRLDLRARVAVLAGDGRSAERDWRAALSAEPGHGSALAGLGRWLLEQGFLDGLERNATARSFREDLARARLAEGAALLERAGEAAPASARALAAGLLAWQAGDLEGALERSAADPRSADLAWLDALCQPASRARAGFDRALAIEPHHRLSRLCRAMRLEVEGDVAGALADYDDLLAFDPDLDVALHNRADLCHRTGDLPGAIRDYRAVIEAGRDDALVRIRLGNALRDAGRLIEAKEAYDQAIVREPSLGRAYHQRAIVRHLLGDKNGALADHELALERMPGDPDALYNRGRVLGELGRLAEAMASYDAALRARPEYPEALTNRGNLHEAAGRPADAIADYEAALRVAPPGWPYRAAVEGRLRGQRGD